ncbi:hypothetical protein [Christensenella tenuis]|uniref:Uncharacterized protein n=1 Tax=Christensenella tenuis TaxID=2763033 RepID=A0ABR7EFZ2_9FIRM|nr:hypothetical protein [Christensenella tenuis]MBC5648064.1 hypothetical protein [Christensenella tenuis]
MSIAPLVAKGHLMEQAQGKRRIPTQAAIAIQEVERVAAVIMAGATTK